MSLLHVGLVGRFVDGLCEFALSYPRGRLQVVGTDNIPISGGFVLATSHTEIYRRRWYVKPYVWLCLFHRVLLKRRGGRLVFRFLAYNKATGLERWALKEYGGLFVEAGKSELNRASLTEAVRIVKDGGVVLIAPEGGPPKTGKHELSRGHRGVGIVALEGRVPVLTVAVCEDAAGRRVSFGKPLRPEVEGYERLTLEEKKQAQQRFADGVMKSVASLLPRKYRGAYS